MECASFEWTASSPSSAAKVVAPDVQPLPFVRAGDAEYALLRTPGLYVAEGAGARSTIAVNTADPQRSNISHTTVKPSSNVGEGGLDRPWWIGCALAAFMLALVEWWTWQRRITV